MTSPPHHETDRNVFEQTMKDALAHLDLLAAEAREAKAHAIEEQVAAKQELQKIQREAEKISAELIEQHRETYLGQLQHKVHRDVVTRLIKAGIPSLQLKKWLGLDPQQLAEIWMDMGFDKITEDHIGHVEYISEGRSGTVIFYRQDVVLRFWYEFGGYDVLAIVHVPDEESWVRNTNLPLEDRMPILEFVARRILRDQAPGHLYSIQKDTIIVSTAQQ